MRLINETRFESGLSEAGMVTCNPAPLVIVSMASRDFSAPTVFLWPLPDTRFPSALHQNGLLVPESP